MLALFKLLQLPPVTNCSYDKQLAFIVQVSLASFLAQLYAMLLLDEHRKPCHLQIAHDGTTHDHSRPCHESLASQNGAAGIRAALVSFELSCQMACIRAAYQWQYQIASFRLTLKHPSCQTPSCACPCASCNCSLCADLGMGAPADQIHSQVAQH